MAWIVKNSATMQVERRDEPYLTDAMKEQLETDVLPRFPTRRAATLPVLHEIQHAHAWLPHQAIEEAAAFLEQTAAEVLDTASFYEEFFLQPRGMHLIWVCQSISCELCGEPDLLRRVQAKLGVEPGQTTPDGRFTLMTAECLGSCGTAPCALVNEELHENLTAGNLETILDRLE